MFAYLGLGPGQEFIPYFLALLAFVWAALLAVLQWPFFALMRMIRGRRQADPVPAAQPGASPTGVPDTNQPPVSVCAERTTKTTRSPV